ncbi:MAG: hypothetical protein ACOY0T_37810 [Myxococcota bacterium]
MPTPTRHPLIETSDAEARKLLSVALKKVPRLTHFGIGVFDERAKIRKGGQGSIQQEFERERALLGERLDEIAMCADWVKRQRRIGRYNMKNTSYGYKHVVERWVDRRGGPHMYVSNGSFIAAAAGLGFEPKEVPGSPNVYFQFSVETVKNPDR